MKCPHCGHNEDRVLETRAQKEGDIRRRRECLICKGRFSTIESVQMDFPFMIKKDGRREPFDPEKLRRGLQLACQKRPVSLAQIEQIVDRISRAALESNAGELPTSWLGQKVMRELRALDDVAYIRFASVYRSFKDVSEFVESLDEDFDLGHTP